MLKFTFDMRGNMLRKYLRPVLPPLVRLVQPALEFFQYTAFQRKKWLVLLLTNTAKQLVFN